MPAVSVVLPVYNGGEFLKMSIESVLKQSFTDFELLILDDCSTDESGGYLKSIRDPRVKCMFNEVNRGLFYNLNFLINKSNSELIKLWSQDDIMNPDCLKTTVEFHKKYPELGFSYSAREVIDEADQLLDFDFSDKTPEIVSRELHAKIALYTGSIAGNIANVCLNRKAFIESGGFKEDMKISGDFDMWVRLAEHRPVGYIKEKLIKLRYHTGQLSRKESFLIFHMIEDLEVYRYLFEYIDDDSKTWAKKILRATKLQFYFTLMLKSLVQVRIPDFKKYYKILSEFDNISKLFIQFIKRKVFKSHWNQELLFEAEEIRLKSR